MTMMAIVIFTVFMIMMVTERVRVTGEPSLGQRFRGFVRAALNARIHFDACLRQRRQCAGTYTSADQGIHAPCPEKVGKGAVARTFGVHDHGAFNDAILRPIELELLRTSKVLKNHSIIVSGRDPS